MITITHQFFICAFSTDDFHCWFAARNREWIVIWIFFVFCFRFITNQWNLYNYWRRLCDVMSCFASTILFGFEYSMHEAAQSGLSVTQFVRSDAYIRRCMTIGIWHFYKLCQWHSFYSKHGSTCSKFEVRSPKASFPFPELTVFFIFGGKVPYFIGNGYKK